MFKFFEILNLVLKSFFFYFKDANDDIQGAYNAGFHGILVKTGKYRENSEKLLSREPLLLAENFAHAIDYLISIN